MSHRLSQIDYDSIAELYDVYVSAKYDFDFFQAELANVNGCVLELTSGTGRLSLILAQSGIDLTCVDCSQEMLRLLSRKLESQNLQAEIFCQDVCLLNIENKFEYAILPFQSFMEIVTEERQIQLLQAVFNALQPGGTFICTMHNPLIRRLLVDGCLHLVGEFPFQDGTLVVSGFEQGADQVVSRLQFFEYYSVQGILQWKRLLKMKFELVSKEKFARMAQSTGFHIDEILGDYNGTPFDSQTSPVMIWRLKKLV